MKDQNCNSHYLISGRQCGWGEDSVAYVSVAEDQDPATVFICEILYGGLLPEGWEDRLPSYEENSFGHWAYINGVIELPFGVTGCGGHTEAMELEGFRFENGKIFADASLPAPR